MSEVQGREEARTGEPKDAEAADADAREARPAGAEAERTAPVNEDSGPADAGGDDAGPAGGEAATASEAGTANAENDEADEAEKATAAEDAVGADASGSGGDEPAEEGGSSAARQSDAQRVKIKMPAAQALPRGDFTPHALGAKGRGAPRSGTRAAARRRRIIYTSGAVVAIALLVGAAVFYETRPEPSPTVKGAFGKAPSVSVPKQKPATKRQVKEPIRGSGPAVANGDYVVAQLVAYQWKAKGGGKELLNTYKKGKPVLGEAGRLTGLDALDKAMVGHKAGSRLVLTLPYKDVGEEIGQQLQLGKTDDFVVTLDLLNSFGKASTAQGTPRQVDDKTLPTVTAGAAGTPPTIKIPAGDPPGKLKVATLIEGSGPVVAKGKTLVVQYHGVLWRNGQVFDSTWQHGRPTSFPIGVKQVIPGWDTGLVGKKVGSRVLLVVPPKDGYGKTGSQDGKIKGTDTLVFVVDILGAF